MSPQLTQTLFSFCAALLKHPRAHLVEDAALTDELLSSLGIDCDGEANVWDD